MKGRVELVRVDLGRWVWWPNLQIVGYIPKGERRETLTLPLRDSRNTEPGALRAIIRELSNQHTQAATLPGL